MMRMGKVSVSKIGERGLRIISAVALAASLGMLTLGGCSSQNADQPTEKPIAANFALEKCQQIMPNMFKCPAIDQPLCTPEFQRTDINCVRIGPKGSVFVQRGGIMP